MGTLSSAGALQDPNIADKPVERLFSGMGFGRRSSTDEVEAEGLLPDVLAMRPD